MPVIFLVDGNVLYLSLRSGPGHAFNSPRLQILKGTDLFVLASPIDGSIGAEETCRLHLVSRFEVPGFLKVRRLPVS